MENLIRFQINLYAITILLALLFLIKTRHKLPTFRKIILMQLILFTLVAIIAEPMTWIFDRQTFIGAYILEYMSNFVLILIAPIIMSFFLSYIDYYIFQSKERIEKNLYYCIPCLITFGLLLINVFFPLFFEIGENNEYIRGDYLWVHYAIIFAFFLYIYSYIFTHRNKTQASALKTFVIFLSLPLFGMIIQIFESELLFSWTSIVLGLGVIYVFLESSSSEVDYLTELYNRKSLDDYILSLQEKKKIFGILYMDLNHFKKVNDQFGHSTGDLVLKEFSDILKKALRPNKMISRIGGDEFIAVIENIDYTGDFLAALYEYLEFSELQNIWHVSFSYGYLVVDKKMTFEEIYHSADINMYEHKNIKNLRKQINEV